MKLWALIPELIISGLCLVLVAGAGWAKGRWRSATGVVAILGLLVSVGFTARMLLWAPQMVMETYAVDGLANVFKLLLEIGAALALMTMLPYFRGHSQVAHVPAAVLFATLGGLGISSSMDLTLIILFLQMISFPCYVLAAIVRADARGLEASIKYFIFGAVGLAVMAYGLTFFYGMTGSLDLRAIGRALDGRAPSNGDPLWVALSLGLVLAGYGFEVTMVPFHAWAPDVITGATAPVSGFIAVVPKIGAFAGIIRILYYAMPNALIGWPWLIAILAVVTMTVGNLAALRQRELKRLLAYSSIAHAGYILTAVAVLQRSETAAMSIAYYLAAYLFMNLGAFAVVAQLERTFGTDTFEAVDGMGRGAPITAVVLTIALLSLAGIPPLAGFVGKVFLLQAAIDGRMLWLAVIAAANMVIALFYYLRIIAAMYLKPDTHAYPLIARRSFAAVHALLLAGTLILGVWPGPIAALARAANNLVR
ncbi:MAG TPA: NADH-quinone oxidoreductase subunit N [Terriglobales bacterium]|nr:NADH-quinone oxidoreductase subunit N [Terriglobales bacterium]